jgi:hypothetical protein
MAFGLIPARGPWENRWFETASAATYAKGSLVNFDAGYKLKEYASTDSQVVGVALSASTQSIERGGVNMVMVAIPSPTCTAYSDLTTGIAQSALSIGKKVCMYKQGNHASYASTVIGHASQFSGVAQIVGPISAADSRVEVAFNLDTLAFYSTSSATFAS